MNPIRRLDFDEMCDLFVALGAHNSPAEMHGLLVGELSAGKRLSQAQWLEEAREYMDSDREFTPEQIEQLQYVYLFTLATLMDENLGFYPLLPDEETAIEERLESLGVWCQGFLAGFALVERSIDELSDELNDTLGDLAAISRIGLNDDDELDATADEDFFNIIEYIRLAVMNIFQDYAVNSPPVIPEGELVEGKPVLTPQSLFAKQQLH